MPGFSDGSTSETLKYSSDSVRSFHAILVFQFEYVHQFSQFLAFMFQNILQLLYSQYNTYANPHFHPYRKEHSPGCNLVLHLLTINITVCCL